MRYAVPTFPWHTWYKVNIVSECDDPLLRDVGGWLRAEDVEDVK